MNQISKETWTGGAHRSQSATTFDGWAQGNPRFKSVIPKADLVSEHRRECVLPRLLLAFPECHDLRPIRKAEKDDGILHLTHAKRRRHVLVNELRAPHELGASLSHSLAEFPRYERHLGVRLKPREPIVDGDKQPRDHHAPRLRDGQQRMLLPAAHQELRVLV